MKLIEEAEYVVRLTLTTTITFSPIERDGLLSATDAIVNAFGTMPDGFWNQLESEGWSIDSFAEKV